MIEVIQKVYKGLTINISKDLYEFLKKKRIIKKFIFNTYEQHLKREYYDTNSICEYGNIAAAFIWTKTKEGKDFWNKINKEYTHT